MVVKDAVDITINPNPSLSRCVPVVFDIVALDIVVISAIRQVDPDPEVIMDAAGATVTVIVDVVERSDGDLDAIANIVMHAVAGPDVVIIRLDEDTPKLVTMHRWSRQSARWLKPVPAPAGGVSGSAGRPPGPTMPR